MDLPKTKSHLFYLGINSTTNKYSTMLHVLSLLGCNETSNRFPWLSSCSFPCLTHLMHFPSLPLFNILSHPSVTGAELPLASSLVAVGSLDLPRQVFYLCFQLGLLVLKLQRTHGGTQTSGQKNHFPHPKRNLTEVTITFVEQIQSQW